MWLWEDCEFIHPNILIYTIWQFDDSTALCHTLLTTIPIRSEADKYTNTTNFHICAIIEIKLANFGIHLISKGSN